MIYFDTGSTLARHMAYPYLSEGASGDAPCTAAQRAWSLQPRALKIKLGNRAAHKYLI